MREAIHPEYHKVGAVCVCGNVIQTGSTLSEIRLDVCSACHPFYTGTQKIMDTEGRVDKFKKRYEGKAQPKKEKKVQAAGDEGQGKRNKKDQAVAVLEAPEVEQAAGKTEVKTSFTLQEGTKVTVEAEIKVEGSLNVQGQPETRISQTENKVEVKTWFELNDGTEVEVEGELKLLGADAEAGEARTEQDGGETEVKRVFALKSGLKLEAECEIEVRGGKALQGQPAVNIESKDNELELKLNFELEDGTRLEIESEIEFEQ